MKALFCLLCPILAFGAPAQAAQATTDSVRTLAGEAVIARDEQHIAARVSEPLYVGDRLRTARDSSLGVILREVTLLSLGGDTQVELREYLF